MAHVANNKGMASGMMGMGSEMMKGMMGPGMMKDMMGPGMMKDMMGPGMMKDMMGPGMMGPGMMGMGPEMMKGMMGSGMGKEAVRGTANIVVLSGGARAGQSVFGRFIRHPAVLLGLGVVTGILIYKYRKEIISEKSE